MGIFDSKRLKELRSIAETQQEVIAKQDTKINDLAGKIGLMSLIKPIEIFDEEQETDYRNTIEQLDRLQNVQFLVDNLNVSKTTFDPYEFANFVYMHGCVMIVWDIENTCWLYGKPMAQTWDYANNIMDCQIILQRYDSTKSKWVDYPGKTYVKGDYFLFYDTMPLANGIPCVSRINYNKAVINQMAEIFARMNINITLATNKLIFESDDPATHALLREEITQEYSRKSPAMVIDTQRFGKQSLAETPTQNYLTEFFALIKQFDQFRQLLNGTGSAQFGVDKTSQNLTDEVKINQDSVDLVANFRKLQCKLFELWIDQKDEAIGVMNNALPNKENTQPEHEPKEQD